MSKTLYKLKVPDHVTTFIRNMHPDLKKKVKSSLQIIISNPSSGKALKDELSGLKSFRTGRFRIIYSVTKNRQIEIVAIGPRKDIYEETYRLLKKGRH